LMGGKGKASIEVLLFQQLRFLGPEACP